MIISELGAKKRKKLNGKFLEEKRETKSRFVVIEVQFATQW